MQLFCFFSICYKGLARIIIELLHFYGKLYLKSKTGLNRHTTILILLPLLSWYVNTCEYITTYNCEHVTNEVIIINDNNQDILAHHNQKRGLLTICIPIYISPSLVKEIASVKTKYYKCFVAKQFTQPFYFNKNSNYGHEEFVKI